MEELSFDIDALRKRIVDLSHQRKVAFLLSIAERLIPNYAAFSRYHDWGDSKILEQALDFGWIFLMEKLLDIESIQRCLERCEAITPDTEDFMSEYVSAALDAAVCCSYVLELLLRDEPEVVIQGAILACDTVDMYIQELLQLDPQDPKVEEKIRMHALMQRELMRQNADLALVERMNFDRGGVEDLMRGFRRPNVSNIGRHT